MKVAIVSETLPPSSSGQAMVLHRLLSDLKADEYCLISSKAYPESDATETFTNRLPAKYYHVPYGFMISRGSRFGLIHLRDGINIGLTTLHWANKLTEILKREGCDAVVACTGDVAHLPAAYLASRRAGTSFFAYLFDHYSYREWRSLGARFWARRLERTILRGADGVIVPNEVLRDDLRLRLGVEAEVIHNSFELADYDSAAAVTTPDMNGEVKIVYTGDVYEAHYDAFHNLLQALRLLERKDVRLHVYTTRTAEEMAEYGLEGPVTFHAHRSLSEMPRIQREADLLFLALAFESPYPGLVKTSSTTKLGEYLATGRPVLVHAPADSFISTYIRTHGCGVVVDRSDPVLLAQKIAEVIDDRDLRQRLTEKARSRVQSDFDISSARAKFLEVLNRPVRRTLRST